MIPKVVGNYEVEHGPLSSRGRDENAVYEHTDKCFKKCVLRLVIAVLGKLYQSSSGNNRPYSQYFVWKGQANVIAVFEANEQLHSKCKRYKREHLVLGTDWEILWYRVSRQPFAQRNVQHHHLRHEFPID